MIAEAVIDVDDLRIDRPCRQVWRGEREVRVTRLEFDFLAALAERPEHVRGYDSIAGAVWGTDSWPTANTMQKAASTLRRKLGEPRLIETVIGVGYRLKRRMVR